MSTDYRALAPRYADAVNEAVLADRPLVIRRGCEVQAQHPEYLWPPRLPRGCYIDLAGDPGVGKTFVAVALAACATRGVWPDGTRTGPVHCVILGAEDALETVLKPRLVAAGADESLYSCIEGVTDSEGGLDDVALDRDLPSILEYLAEVKAGLLYIDALVDVLAAHDGKGYVESRQAMRVLGRLAREANVSLLATRHMKKAADGVAWKQAIGSVAYASKARVMLQVYSDRSVPERRVLAVPKHNTAPLPASLAFRLTTTAEDDAPRVEWLGTDDRTADQLAAETADTMGRQDRGPDTTTWLRGVLQDGVSDQREILDAARAAGYAQASVYRAADKLGVARVVSGFGKQKRSIWTLPPAQFSHSTSFLTLRV